MKKEIIWLTGASSGIGKELALLFAKSDITIAASARNIELLKKLRDSLGEKKEFLKVYQCDVSSYDSITETYNKITKDFHIAGLINNAGVTSFRPAIEDSIEGIQNIINTNLLGSIYTIKSVLPAMMSTKKGDYCKYNLCSR